MVSHNQLFLLVFLSDTVIDHLHLLDFFNISSIPTKGKHKNPEGLSRLSGFFYCVHRTFTILVGNESFERTRDLHCTFDITRYPKSLNRQWTFPVQIIIPLGENSPLVCIEFRIW